MSGSEDEFSDSSSTHSYSSFFSSPATALRQNLHRFLIPYIHLESHFIAALQRRWRSPFWDKYFVYTSSLGTHTFFMILLPAVFFFGFDVGGEAGLGGNKEMGMGLVMIMGLGVYASSFVKDLVCSPRPFAPPVTRLTLGNHHLEYGFPSTHSTNAVSIALFFYGYVYNLYHPSLNPTATPLTYYFLTTVLVIYTLSIVLGRIYTAMHSVMDCVAGCVLGAVVWWVVTDVPVRFGVYGDSLGWTVRGFGASNKLQAWVVECVASASIPTTFAAKLLQSPLSPPFLLTSIFLLIINQHPQPIDDCPCFEDAVAMGAVVYGSLVGIWGRVYFAQLQGTPLREVMAMATATSTFVPATPMLGAPWHVLPSGTWVPYPPSSPSPSSSSSYFSYFSLFPSIPFPSLLLLLTIALLKLTLGITLIFTWRLSAKFLLGITLPPIFRAVARALGGVKAALDWGLGEMGVGRGERGRWIGWLGMPNRRFYLPATEYRGGVPNLLSPSVRRAGAGGLEGGAGGGLEGGGGAGGAEGDVKGGFGFVVGQEGEEDGVYGYRYGNGNGYEGSEDEEEEGRVMRPIPSVIDLPSSLRMGVEDRGVGAGSGAGREHLEDMRLTSRTGVNKSKQKEKKQSWQGESASANGNGNGNGNGNQGVNEDGNGKKTNGGVGNGNGNGKEEKEKEKEKEKLTVVIPEEKQHEGSGVRQHRHYDADVLTKVIVYTGIAILSIELTPRLFEIIGWGVWVGPPPGAVVDFDYERMSV